MSMKGMEVAKSLDAAHVEMRRKRNKKDVSDDTLIGMAVPFSLTGTGAETDPLEGHAEEPEEPIEPENSADPDVELLFDEYLRSVVHDSEIQGKYMDKDDLTRQIVRLRNVKKRDYLNGRYAEVISWNRHARTWQVQLLDTWAITEVQPDCVEKLGQTCLPEGIGNRAAAEPGSIVKDVDGIYKMRTRAGYWRRVDQQGSYFCRSAQQVLESKLDANERRLLKAKMVEELRTLMNLKKTPNGEFVPDPVMAMLGDNSMRVIMRGEEHIDWRSSHVHMTLATVAGKTVLSWNLGAKIKVIQKGDFKGTTPDGLNRRLEDEHDYHLRVQYMVLTLMDAIDMYSLNVVMLQNCPEAGSLAWRAL